MFKGTGRFVLTVPLYVLFLTVPVRFVFDSTFCFSTVLICENKKCGTFELTALLYQGPTEFYAWYTASLYSTQKQFVRDFYTIKTPRIK
jgi:hypothetical protein